MDFTLIQSKLTSYFSGCPLGRVRMPAHIHSLTRANDLRSILLLHTRELNCTITVFKSPHISGIEDCIQPNLSSNLKKDMINK
jgi:hypothetical protein